MPPRETSPRASQNAGPATATDDDLADVAARRSPLTRLGGVIGRNPGTWVVGWVVVAIACFAVAVGGVTGESLFQRLHSGDPSVSGEASAGRAVIESVEPSSTSLTLQVSGADLTDPAVVAAGAASTRAVSDVPGVAAVRSPLLAPGWPDRPVGRPAARRRAA